MRNTVPCYVPTPSRQMQRTVLCSEAENKPPAAHGSVAQQLSGLVSRELLLRHVDWNICFAPFRGLCCSLKQKVSCFFCFVFFWFTALAQKQPVRSLTKITLYNCVLLHTPVLCLWYRKGNFCTGTIPKCLTYLNYEFIWVTRELFLVMNTGFGRNLPSPFPAILLW